MFRDDDYVRLDDGTYILYEDLFASLCCNFYADVVSIDELGGVCE